MPKQTNIHLSLAQPGKFQKAPTTNAYIAIVATHEKNTLSVDCRLNARKPVPKYRPIYTSQYMRTQGG